MCVIGAQVCKRELNVECCHCAMSCFCLSKKKDLCRTGDEESLAKVGRLWRPTEAEPRSSGAAAQGQRRYGDAAGATCSSQTRVTGIHMPRLTHFPVQPRPCKQALLDPLAFPTAAGSRTVWLHYKRLRGRSGAKRRGASTSTSRWEIVQTRVAGLQGARCYVLRKTNV